MPTTTVMTTTDETSEAMKTPIRTGHSLDAWTRLDHIRASEISAAQDNNSSTCLDSSGVVDEAASRE
jgi:hypothetical protein